ncbi:MAG: hypothetical protein HQ472_03330 [Ignavibacteria bacterium]|nr:hypothetical protein [Ignavibacteria bacterium]
MPNEFSAIQVMGALFRKKWWIIAISAITAIGTYAYVRTLPEYFKSTVNCVPPRIDNSMLGGGIGGVGSALKDFGLTKLGGKQGDGFEFIVILFTRSIRDSMIRRFDLAKEYEMEGKPLEKVRLEFEDNLQINLHFEGNYEISIWSRDSHKAADMCNYFVGLANEIANRVHREEATKSTEYLNQRIDLIDSALFALTDSLSRYSKDYLLFAPVEQAKASASAVSEIMANIMKQETVLGLLERNYGAEDPQVRAQRALVSDLKKQQLSLRTEPGFGGDFKLTDAAGLGAQFLRLTSEFEAHAKLKAFLLPTLEQAQLDKNKTTPSLIVVDPPQAADKKDRPKRALIAAGSGIGTGVLAILFFMMLPVYSNFKKLISKPENL